MKKITAALLIIAFTAAFLPAAGAMAAAGIPVYKVDGTLVFFDKASGEISGFAGEPSSLTIPAYISGYRVNTIGRAAFQGCKTLKSIAFEEGLTAIGEKAFQGCVNLKSVELPASVGSLGESAFKGCTALSQVDFAGAIASVAADAFDSTAWIEDGDEFKIAGKTLLLKYNGRSTDVIVPDGVTRIAPSAFAYNAFVERLSLPQSLTEIGNNAFVHCDALKGIDFPDSLSYVGVGAFDGTPWLRGRSEEFVSVGGILVAYNGTGGCVEIPEGITSVGCGVFMSDERVTAVSLPSTLETVGEAAFSDMDALSAVIVPDGVSFIDEYAFNGTPNVTLFGSPGSYAENYAQRGGLLFSAPISVDVNGQGVYFDVPPIIINGSAYVPMRAVLEAMGLSVQWMDFAREAVISGKMTAVTAAVDKTAATVNGEPRELSLPPVMLGGRVMLPVRTFAELFGFSVDWDGGQRRVIINSKE